MQKPKTNNRLFPNFFAPLPPRPAKTTGFLEQIFGLKEGWYKNRDFGRNNFELGMKQFKAGNVSDAVFRFKLVTWKNPQHAEGWYWLGRSLIREGKKEEAVQALKKAQSLNYMPEETRYMMAVAMGKSAPESLLPTRMPHSLIKEHFEGVASNYVATIEVGQHKEHILAADAARAAAQVGRIDHVVLDLGVGTGLCGVRLRDISAHITGVDISGKMLEQAMQLKAEDGRKLYDALIHREAQEFLNASAGDAFDMVLAAGLADYVGDLDELWQQTARVLKPGGLFVITASMLPERGYRFDTESQHFRFSRDYLETLASKYRVAVLGLQETPVADGQVMWLGVFRK